ncbi:hypothetical protein AJ80_02151 [Polytolypa hystricis UAMH7299]|uniref:Uncharacterized protein n=1 Tax=Polytolypa hystricis (strain UAMH7299) TaxID=1447883 RepID=A0A2B7YRV4_POLH7|nr:hypothetical protein AJ80_02151 [Polytolypa hystricis UAMH7299]
MASLTPDQGALLEELQTDLARKYRLHGPRVEQIWRSFDRNKGEDTIRAGAADGVIMPEWNLRDMADPESDSMLDLLEHRATKSLSEQYRDMRVNNLRHVNPFKHSFTILMDEGGYGQSYYVANERKYREMMAGMSSAVNAGLCVPRATGELILERQVYLPQSLNILVEDILGGGSTAKKAKERSKKPDETATNAFSTLSLDSKKVKLSLEDLLAASWDQKESLEAYLTLCRVEPDFLAHAVKNWFFSRPELLQDEKGRSLPLHTDKFISVAVFELIHNAVTGPAIWTASLVYYSCLLTIRMTKFTKRSFYRRSPICVTTSSGSKYFKRLAGVYDNGTARVNMKTKPDNLLRENAQLHHMLRLCQPETDVFKAVEWIKRGKICVSKLKALVAELETMKQEIDLSDFAVPIDNLMEPVMAEGALDTLDKFIVETSGMEIGFLYQDLNEECLAAIQAQCQEQKAKAEQSEKKKKGEFAPLQPLTPPTQAPSRVTQIQQRKEKQKTRPPHSSVYSISPATKSPTETETETAEPSPVFKVKPSTFDVFSTLFSKARSRGSVSWDAFTSAMADLKFSFVPKFGSVFTFYPPEELGMQKSLTVHRPHRLRIEGHKVLMFAHQLRRQYRWGEQSFETQ